jgi:hypothetical protein
MNIYDKKSIHCSQCDRFMGEIDVDAVVVLPKCGRCANPMPEGDDKVLYIVSKFNLNPKSLVPKKDYMDILQKRMYELESESMPAT